MSEPTYTRYVALGDSQTEGLGDGDESTGWRGWADRLAELLAELNPSLHYANLAVRGRLAGQVRAEQLEPAIAMEPDLATVFAGMNDLLRPRFDVERVGEDLEAMFDALTGAGARVATIAYPNFGAFVPLARPLVPRIVALNARIAAAAARYDVTVLESFHVPVTTDLRLWSIDRLHASPEGHTRIAAAMAHALALPGSSAAWAESLPAFPNVGFMRTAGTELNWLTSFLGPWISRRIHGRSSGEDHTAKRPRLTPFRQPLITQCSTTEASCD